VHNQCYLLRSQPLLWIRSRLRWILADHHGEIVIWGGLGGGSPFRDMISKSLSHYFGDVFLNQSRFDAANLFEIWQQLATRRDSMFVDHDTDPSQRVVISRVAQMDTEVTLKFVGKKMARPPPIWTLACLIRTYTTSIFLFLRCTIYSIANERASIYFFNISFLLRLLSATSFFTT